MNRSILFLPVILTVAAPFSARADISLNSFLVNGSFEVPTTLCCSFPTGWSGGGTASGGSGNWNPSSDPLAKLHALGGSQVAWINNYSGAKPTGELTGGSQLGGSPELNYQYLAQTVALPGGMVAGQTYVLNYAVAIRADIPEPLYYRVQINGNYDPITCPLCDSITSGSTQSFVAGQWYWNTVKYTASAADAGLNPTIYLVNDGAISGNAVLTQAEFDVPEPLGALLLGVQMAAIGAIALIWRRRRTS